MDAGPEMNALIATEVFDAEYVYYIDEWPTRLKMEYWEYPDGDRQYHMSNLDNYSGDPVLALELMDYVSENADPPLGWHIRRVKNFFHVTIRDLNGRMSSAINEGFAHTICVATLRWYGALDYT